MRKPITREPDGDGFIYRSGAKRVTKRADIARIEALVIPPAWVEVEISRSASAKVLARGTDAAGRTQAIYHPSYRKRRDRKKFERLERFGRALPRLRARIDRDLRRKRLNKNRVTAGVLRLIDLHLFRVGGAESARKNSYGATTLREKHVTIASTALEFDFIGKSGKRHRRSVKDARLTRLVERLLDMPGPELFTFFDEDGIVHNLRSTHVNAYVKRHMGAEFTAKDFRTWGATVTVATALFDLDPGDVQSEAGRTRAVRDAVKLAAERLGNTPAVARSSYVHPSVLTALDHPRVLARVKKTSMRAQKLLSAEEQRALRLLTALQRVRRG